MHTYIQTEPTLWTVGHYEPGTGKWIPESDYPSPELAADRVITLNGGQSQKRVSLETIIGRWPLEKPPDGMQMETAKLYFSDGANYVVELSGHSIHSLAGQAQYAYTEAVQDYKPFQREGFSDAFTQKILEAVLEYRQSKQPVDISIEDWDSDCFELHYKYSTGNWAYSLLLEGLTEMINDPNYNVSETELSLF